MYVFFLAFLVGAHRLKGGQASEHMILLDNIENLQEDSSIVNPFLPRNGTEARETLKIAMYQQFSIPLRLLEAMASMRLSQYPQYLKGKYNGELKFTLYWNICNTTSHMTFVVL